MTTFVAFLLVGMVPLLPYAMPDLEVTTRFFASLALAGGVFLSIGMLKSLVYGLRPWRSGLRTLIMGAAGLAFGAGSLVQSLLGVWA